jgi:serine/threonine protein kinase
LTFAAALTPPAVIQFQELLKRSRPPIKADMDVIYNIAKMFAAEMQVCVDLQSPSRCHDLYDIVKLIPSTTTRGVIRNQSNIVLNGPVSTEAKNILLGVDIAARRRVLVKIVNVQDTPWSMSREEREEAKSAEVEACTVFTALDVDGLVKCDVVQVDIQSVEDLGVGLGIWQAIKMHDYGISLAKLPQLPEDLIEEGFRRILNALSSVHSAGYVHMDVKSANVFVTTDLLWDLGDFGSARKCGEQCYTWTPELTPYAMSRKFTVIKEMDIVQLCVMIAVELTKEKWGETLLGRDSSVQKHCVLDVLLSIRNKGFQDEIVTLFQKSMTAIEEHIREETISKQS